MRRIGKPCVCCGLRMGQTVDYNGAIKEVRRVQSRRTKKGEVLCADCARLMKVAPHGLSLEQAIAFAKRRMEMLGIRVRLVDNVRIKVESALVSCACGCGREFVPFSGTHKFATPACRAKGPLPRRQGETDVPTDSMGFADTDYTNLTQHLITQRMKRQQEEAR